MKIVWLTVTAAVIAMALLFAALVNGDSAVAQTADTPTPEATEESGDNFGDQQLPPIEGKLNPPQYPNMDSNLNRIVQQAESGIVSSNSLSDGASTTAEESVAATIYFTEGYADAISAYLESNGASPRNIGIDYIEAYIPVSLLPEASQQEGVITIRTIVRPQPAQGVVVSEGSAAHGAPAWHATGVKGQGVKIGVIDVGFEGFRTLMGSELPEEGNVRVRCYADIGVLATDANDCINSSGSKHGTAVAEALFDIAPEATYYISNPDSFGDLQTAVQWMIDNDVDVVNHSVSWGWNGPGDGTSPFSNSPLRAVDTAVEDGITWVNSAGNGSQNTWFGPFEDSDGDGDHNFGVNIDCNTIDLKAGEEVTLVLRWDDNWLGASRDLDLYLIPPDASGRFFLRNAVASELEQSGRFGDYPLEAINTSVVNDMTACIVVSQFRGARPAWMQLQSRGIQALEFHTLSGGIGNPAESANSGLLAVGAAPWDNTSTIEPYSDQGPAPDGRTKPDIVGADLGQSVTLRSANNPNGYFPGTSQASPHIAGLAALVKQRFPNYTPQQIANYLKNNAEPRGAVPNNTWGYGFAKLPAIAPEPAATPTPIPTPGTTPEPTPVAPQVPEEVLNKISALETLVATLQSLISTLQNKLTALDSRVAALETNASVPTPIPTATLAPTPTTVPGAPTPIPTPVPTATPVLAATPITDACVTPITGNGVITASWISTCQSTNRPIDPDRPDDGTYYARYYTFDLSAPSSVSITLESGEDTFLYLLHGKGETGSVAHFNDDIDYPVNSNSRIEQTLEAGSYTIEATTYDSGVVDSNFTLTLVGIE